MNGITVNALRSFRLAKTKNNTNTTDATRANPTKPKRESKPKPDDAK